MQLFATYVYAKCPFTGDIKQYGGPNIRAWNKEEAFAYCQKNGLGYCQVNGDVIVAEVPCKGDTFEPDFDNMIDFEIAESPNNKRIYMPKENAWTKWLDEKGIEWHPDDASINAIWVQEKNLIPYEEELREKFPEFKFSDNAIRYDVEPNAPK